MKMNENQLENTAGNSSWLAYDENQSEMKIISQDGNCLFTMKFLEEDMLDPCSAMDTQNQQFMKTKDIIEDKERLTSLSCTDQFSHDTNAIMSVDDNKILENDCQVQGQSYVPGFLDIRDIKQEKHYDCDYDCDYHCNYSWHQDNNQICDSDSARQLNGGHDIVSEDFECICIKCNKWFKCERHLENHETIVHKGERPFKCPYCDKVFAHKNTMKLHQKIHESHQMTDKTYTSSKKTAEDNNKKLVHCFICNKNLQFRCEADIRKHFTMHKPFKCIICNESFPLKTALESHLQTSCGQKPYMCKLCGKTFKCASKLKRHEESHEEKPYECPNCNRFFKRKPELQRHQKRYNGKNTCKCTICNSYFASSSTLRIHKLVHSEERPFQCSICNKTFKRKRYLNVHQRVHTGEAPFKCSICNKAYKQKSQLNAHVLIHSEEKLFHCAICNKTFNRKSTLYSHRRFVHSQERPFQCEVCSKTFKQKSVLNLHTKTHNSKTKLGCSMCKELFDRKSTLLKHVRFFHSGDQYKCTICFKAFVEESGLERHQKLHIDEKKMM